jgi:hypothetical protein
VTADGWDDGRDDSVPFVGAVAVAVGALAVTAGALAVGAALVVADWAWRTVRR